MANFEDTNDLEYSIDLALKKLEYRQRQVSFLIQGLTYFKTLNKEFDLQNRLSDAITSEIAKELLEVTSTGV